MANGMEDEAAVNAQVRGKTWNEGAAEKRVGVKRQGQHMAAGNGNVGMHSDGHFSKKASGKTARSSNVYRILFAVVAVFFLVETIGNGIVFLRSREMDLKEELLLFPRAAVKQLVTAGDGARFVPRVLVERLLLSNGRATLAELRKEARASLRPPRLALVCVDFISYFIH